MKGKITITIPDVGKPTTEFMGEIPARVIQSIPHIVRKGYRSHVYAIRRNLDKVDIADTGSTVASQREVGKVNTPEPQPDPDVELKMPLTPQQILQRAKDSMLNLDGKEDLTEEANNPKESETQDAIDRETEGTGGDAEGPRDPEGT